MTIKLFSSSSILELIIVFTHACNLTLPNRVKCVSSHLLLSKIYYLCRSVSLPRSLAVMVSQIFEPRVSHRSSAKERSKAQLQ